MRLSTEDLQYLEIALWKDYSDRLTIKKNEIRQKRDFNKMFIDVDSILRKNNNKKIN